MTMDPKAKGLAILMNDLSDAIDYLVNQATGGSDDPVIHEHETGHLDSIGDFLDSVLGKFGKHSVISSSAIERGTDAVFSAAMRNPRLAPLLRLKGIIKDVLKVGFSSRYQGKSFGEAVTDRGLSKFLGISLDGWMPEAKSLFTSSAIQSIKFHDED